MPNPNMSFDPGTVGTPYAGSSSSGGGAGTYPFGTQFLFSEGKIYAIFPDGTKQVAAVATVVTVNGQTYWNIPGGPWGAAQLVSFSAGGGGFGGGGGGGGGGGISMAPVYQKIAASYGFPGLSGAEAAGLEKGMVSVDEWTTRMIGLRFMFDNPDAHTQLTLAARANGLLNKNESATKTDVFNLVTGTDNKFRTFWEEASARAVAAQTGYTIGKGEGALVRSRQDIQDLIKAIPGNQTVTDLLPIYQQAATIALANASWSKYKGYGLARSDFEEIVAGVAPAEKLDALNRIIGEQQEFNQLRQPLQLAGMAGRQGGLG